MTTQYKRILLKLSGEALAGKQGYGVDLDIISSIAEDIRNAHDAGTELAIVIGGGNIFRGLAGATTGFDRTTGDTIGMLATLVNSLMLKETLRQKGLDARVMSATSIEKAAELFLRDKAIHHLKKGRVVIIAGGTGNPYFTTDTAAALRCAELDCDILMKATKVDGIYDKDPHRFPDAVKYSSLTHAEAIKQNLKIMDLTAFSLCMDNDIPILVFELLKKGNLLQAIRGNKIGTTVWKGLDND